MPQKLRKQAGYVLVCYTAVFRVVTQRSSPLWGGALRDDTKNGCVADWICLQIHKFRSINRSFASYGRHAMHYFAPLGIFMRQGCRTQS